ncbi:cytochrome d ubiquinol oxidase subunit II [Actinomadura sp. ATCC 31491]|uniref:Cytochrome d ubiquinol oxidase subunit II n=1 Tax=Actinomadura luzonensis TaxID=2805427 RepID=A0ABT0FYL6_9ACTN|nr:cytochrome d ubiquinol oxidase subunit II [Actinomadura luzonensis]MCK2217405.1 cytochrome d ubiquinol oxidase subunit II [Actinomadura luzonensis]
MIDLWFVIIAFLWTGYFVLEGFDFGVGLLAPVLSRNAAEQRQSLETIGPVWDGNEVWLITAVGAMFAAFPAWYAGVFSAFYLQVTLILVGLILRGVGLEWRGKVRDPRWCDLAVMVGSGLPAFLWGAVFAGLLSGSAPAALLGGAFTLAVCVLHGAVFLALKTTGPVRRRARATALTASAVVIPVAVLALSSLGTFPALAAMAALAAAAALTWRRREGWAFAATAGAIVLATLAVFMELRTSPLPGLTLTEAASGSYTLTMLSWIGLVTLPFVLVYQGWTYYVFRKRVRVAV